MYGPGVQIQGHVEWDTQPYPSDGASLLTGARKRFGVVETFDPELRP